MRVSSHRTSNPIPKRYKGIQHVAQIAGRVQSDMNRSVLHAPGQRQIPESVQHVTAPTSQNVFSFGNAWTPVSAASLRIARADCVEAFGSRPKQLPFRDRCADALIPRAHNRRPRIFLLLPLLLHELLALRTKSQILARFFVEPAAFIAVEHRLTDQPERDFRPEIIFAVEPLDPLDQLASVQPRVLVVRKLVADFIRHRLVDRDQAVLLNVIVELGARKRMPDRDLNRLDIQLFGKIDALADRLGCLTRQPDNKVAVNDQPELLAVCREIGAPCRSWRLS